MRGDKNEIVLFLFFNEAPFKCGLHLPCQHVDHDGAILHLPTVNGGSSCWGEPQCPSHLSSSS